MRWKQPARARADEFAPRTHLVVRVRSEMYTPQKETSVVSFDLRERSRQAFASGIVGGGSGYHSAHQEASPWCYALIPGSFGARVAGALLPLRLK